MAEYTLIDLVAPELAEKDFSATFGHPLLNPGGHVGVEHIVLTGVVVVVIAVLALIARRKYASREQAIVPEGRLTVRNFFEVIFDAVLGMMTDMMGPKNARRYFPAIAALAVFILFGNLMGLVPGLAPPTDNLNTNVAASVTVFVLYNIAGFREHGISYVKQFMGPIWLIAPLMVVIEVIGHIFRPVSLAIRLTGNMTGDHLVVGVFGQLAASFFHWAGLPDVPFLLPIPFLVLGLLVAVIQTLVFCLLSTIYISLAVSHEGH